MILEKPEQIIGQKYLQKCNSLSAPPVFFQVSLERLYTGVMFSHFISTPLCFYRPILFHPYLCEFVFAEENRCFQFDSSGNIAKFIFIVLDHDDMLLANICPAPYQVNIYNSQLSHFQFYFVLYRKFSQPRQLYLMTSLNTCLALTDTLMKKQR